MAELVYAFDLKSNGETRTGSSPVSATKSELLSEFSRLGAKIQTLPGFWSGYSALPEPILKQN